MFLLLLLGALIEFSYCKEEICCCPDLSVQLTCAGTDTTKVNLETNGYRCVAETAATVTLKCGVTDVDHDAIKSVTYQYHKAADLDYNPLATKDSGKSVKLQCDSAVPTCEVANVKWGTETGSENLDKHDSFNYQCYVTFVLKDDSTFSIPSNTMWIDVLQNVDVAAKQAVTIDTIAKGPLATKYPYERLNCDLDITNPPTKATWFKQQDDKSWKEINVPQESRMLLVDDKIDTESESNFKRGTLVLMLFEEADAGMYKCEAKYDTDSTVGTSTTYKVAQYDVTKSGKDYGGQKELDKVSAITSRKYTKVDEYTDFTCYVRDTDATTDLYRWTYKNSESKDMDVDLTVEPFVGITLENYNRTMRVPSDYKYHDIEFKCKVGAKSSVEFTQPVIIPKTFDIPVTTKTCINKDSGVLLYSNEEYMMSNEVDVANYEQKLPGSKFRWFIGEQSITKLKNLDKNGGITNETTLKIPGDNDFMTDNPRTCKYFTFVQYNSNNYMIYEMLKVTQPETACSVLSGEVCNEENLDITQSEDAKTITATLASTVHAQCLTVEIKKDEKSFKTAFSKTAASCATRTLTLSVTTVEIMAEMNVTELKGEVTVSLVHEDKTLCSRTFALKESKSKSKSNSWLYIMIAVLIAVVIIAIVVVVVYKYKDVLFKKDNSSDKPDVPSNKDDPNNDVKLEMDSLEEATVRENPSNTTATKQVKDGNDTQERAPEKESADTVQNTGEQDSDKDSGVGPEEKVNSEHDTVLTN